MKVNHLNYTQCTSLTIIFCSFETPFVFFYIYDMFYMWSHTELYTQCTSLTIIFCSYLTPFVCFPIYYMFYMWSHTQLYWFSFSERLQFYSLWRLNGEHILEILQTWHKRLVSHILFLHNNIVLYSTVISFVCTMIYPFVIASR